MTLDDFKIAVKTMSTRELDEYLDLHPLDEDMDSDEPLYYSVAWQELQSRTKPN